MSLTFVKIFSLPTYDVESSYLPFGIEPFQQVSPKSSSFSLSLVKLSKI